MFKINETCGNLFDFDKDYALAHYISADCGFEVGLAQFFQARYSTRDELRQRFPQLSWNDKGFCIVTNNNNVFNLIIKNKQFEKPSLRNLGLALAHMKKLAMERNIKKIAIPRIGIPGGDINYLTNIFSDIDIEIRIIYLHEHTVLRIIE